MSYHGSSGRRQARKYLDYVKACERCGGVEWLQPHHKDHNTSNNRRDNIEILCWPCHQAEHHAAGDWRHSPGSGDRMSTKTDNSNLPSKIELRAHFLGTPDGPWDVLDCCQGSGVLWSQLRERFEVERYLGLDRKASPGRLKIDSSRYLQAAEWRHNFIDIDTYGEPWKHWLALLPNLAGPAVVTMTLGHLGPGGLSGETKAALGIGGFECIRPRFGRRLTHIAVPYLLSAAAKHGFEIAEALEAPASPRARYFGVRLVPVS